jgi:hypothetical protein
VYDDGKKSGEKISKDNKMTATEEKELLTLHEKIA